FTTASVGIHDLAMSARRSLTRGIGELLRLLDPGLSDLVRTPQTDRAMVEEEPQVLPGVPASLQPLG
ncbi:hypothetical protein, partial [Aeromonas sp. ASNIH8]|uniref:hypothetical protein n=1 Tax=Aeromonas sp. ASNIH8 TaxID=1920113 RepID=UPI001CA52FB0